MAHDEGNRSRLLVALALLGGLISGQAPLHAQAQPAAAPAGTSTTGQKIGNVISAAVSTAFPAVSSIINAIWGSAGNKNAVKAKDAAPALQTAKDNATVAQKSNSDELTAIAKNLAVLRSFVTECGFAGVQLAKMQTLIGSSTAPALNKDEEQKLHDYWDAADKRLETLAADAVGQKVDGMTDDYLKGTLGGIRDSIKDNSSNITKQIDQGRRSELSLSIADLFGHVNGVAALTGLLIGDLSASLAVAATNISSKAGGEEVDPVANRDRANNIDLLNKTYNLHLK